MFWRLLTFEIKNKKIMMKEPDKFISIAWVSTVYEMLILAKENNATIGEGILEVMDKKKIR